MNGHIASQIYQYRQKFGWSQARLAEIAKVPQSAISEIESGKRKNPGIKTLERLASALGVSVSELLGEDERPTGTEGR